MYYDASVESLCCIWQRPHTITEFEQVLSLSLDFLKAYRTPNWISDIRNVPMRNEEDLNKIRSKFRDEYLKLGVNKIAVVLGPEDYEVTARNQKQAQIKNAYPVEYGFFDSLKEAREWISLNRQ